jgi:hypothetical protein
MSEPDRKISAAVISKPTPLARGEQRELKSLRDFSPRSCFLPRGLLCRLVYTRKPGTFKWLAGFQRPEDIGDTYALSSSSPPALSLAAAHKPILQQFDVTRSCTALEEQVFMLRKPRVRQSARHSVAAAQKKLSG